ncbi:TonB-dependent receptor [Hymenobacter roseosalivarius DSM 11622]|uniref:TonB-dependent receptor n=1 Tax=Hymenobacter roseosalivarius DSM 11622 TaxID=645990 RepID=A0A1W1VE08_9BACT|nr:TonB-dependent receptor [Hymenobacter roseosalivarius]SMB91608.1 TonB-dependent receptor [Hymenobacter roseosalivarius DSM 11622]
MKHALPLLLAGLGLFSHTFAQTVPTPTPRPALVTPPAAPRGSASLSGTVTDAKTGQPVEYATVALLDQATDKAVDGGICDEKGRFAFSKLPPGTYKVSISFVGYQTKVLDTVRLTDTSLNLGGISLTATTQQLGEVKVTGERDLVENKVDRIVYNADKDITNSGGTAADVLKKVPLLAVDLDGNVELRGSSNVRVLINNKPSTIVASSVADALRQIPADQIKTVEVITSPSAKYDAEGTGGIINIILKKNDLAGVNGSVNVSAGTRSSNLNTSLNARKGKVGVNANLGSFGFYNRGRGETFRRDFEGTTTIATLTQLSTNRTLGGGIYGQVGADYDLTPKDAFNLSARGNLFRFSSPRTLRSEYITGAGPDIYSRDIEINNQNRNLDLNFGYTKTLARPRQEFSALALYSVNKGQNEYDLDQFRPELTGPDYREQSFNDSRNREATFQADLVQPLDSTSTLELGAKSILRQVNTNYQIEADFDGQRNSAADFVPLPDRTNQFRYDQDVYSGYATYAFSLRKVYSFKLGSRLEHTRIGGDFFSNDTEISQRYTNFIPSLVASRDFGKDKSQKLKLSYTRRVQRPNIYFLNPYLNTSDPRVFSSGNPNLDAELTDSYELGYSTFIKKSNLNFSLYSRRTNNAIESVSRLVPLSTLIDTDDAEAQVLYSTFQNVARNATYGASVFGSTKLTEKWTLNGNVNTYYVILKSPSLNISNSGLMYNANLSSSWQFSKGYSAQFSGFLNSPRVQLQGRSSAYQYYSLAAKKELFKKKGSLSIGLDNPFNRAIRFRNELDAARFSSRSVNYNYNRGVRVSFNYQFGKMDSGAGRPKKSIRNDDQKSGGDGQGQQ